MKTISFTELKLLQLLIRTVSHKTFHINIIYHYNYQYVTQVTE